MAFEPVRKPSAKSSSSPRQEEHRKQLPKSEPTTRSRESTIPRYLRSELEQAPTPAPKSPATPTTGAAPTTVAGDLGRAEPLAPQAASRFSHAYGHDLSQVRVHPDSPKPGALGARAFTVGNDIAFAPGTYQPGSTEGQRLLGHELAHVVQQSGQKPTLQGKGLSSDSPEQEADRAAEAALSGEPVSSLSPVGQGTVQLQAAGAPAAGPVPGKPKAGQKKAQPGEIDLSRGMLDASTVRIDENGRAMARLGSLASGEFELVQGEGGYSTRGQGAALPLSLPSLDSILGGRLVLAVRIENNVITGHAAIGKPGRAVPRNDSTLLGALGKDPEALGLRGLSKLGIKSLHNTLENGVLKLGAESVDFTLSGFVTGSGQLHFENDQIRFGGQAEVKLPGGSGGKLQVNYSPEKGLSGETHLEVSIGKVSGGADARLNQGVLDIQGTASYAGDQLKGTVTLLATDAATARDITTKDPQAGGLPTPGGEGSASAGAAGPGAAGAQAKPGPRAFCGWGELDFSLTEWLTGRVKVVVGSTGEATVRGEIAPPKEIILFEQKEWTKSLLKAEARALYGLPVVGNVFVFANVGLEALATIGPGKLYNIKLSGQYSTDKRVDKELNLQASLNISAFAGLRLRAEGGVGIELLDHDIKAGVGVWALAGVRGYVEATPTIGYRQKAGAAGEFYIQGHMELAAQPFLGLGGDLFVEVDSPWWSPLPDDKWTWPLGSIEYPLPGEFGIGADVEHVLGSKQWPEVKFTEVDFDSGRFMSDLLSQSAPGKSKGGEDNKPAKWNEGGAAGAPAGGKPEGKSATAPAKAPATGGKKGSKQDANGKTAKGKGAESQRQRKNGKDRDGQNGRGTMEDSFTGPIGEAVPFSDGKQGHRLWVEEKGGRARLMVASEPMTVEERLGKWESSLDKLSPKQQTNAQRLLSTSRSLLTAMNGETVALAALKASASARQYHEQKSSKSGKKGGNPTQSPQQLNQHVKNEEHRLADALAALFRIFQTTDYELGVPKSLAVQKKAALRMVSSELARDLLDSEFKSAVLYDKGEDAATATRRILQEKKATYDTSNGQLVFPGPTPKALSQANSAREFAELVADQTGAPKVVYHKTGEESVFDIHINPSATAATVSRNQLSKHISYHVNIGIRLSNGTLTSIADYTAPMERLLLQLRSLRHGDAFTLQNGDQLDTNMALANIQVSGVTETNEQKIFTRPLGREGVLSVFSSGSGELKKEFVQLKVVDHRGRVLREGTGLSPEDQKRAPVISLLQVEIVTVGHTPKQNKATGTQPDQVEPDDHDVSLRIAEVIPSDAYLHPQSHKHSEQAIFALLVNSESAIADWVRTLRIKELNQFVLHIHTEREMCTQCAKAGNAFLERMPRLMPELWKLLQHAKHPAVANVTSSMEYPQGSHENLHGAGPNLQVSAPTLRPGNKPEMLSATENAASLQDARRLIEKQEINVPDDPPQDTSHPRPRRKRSSKQEAP